MNDDTRPPLTGYTWTGALRSAACRQIFHDWCAANSFELTGPSTWSGSKVYVPARCPVGHVCQLRPSHIKRGVGGCDVCSGRSTTATRGRFLDWCAERGFTLDPGFEWVGGQKTRYPATCPAGHSITLHPASILSQKLTGCSKCSGYNPVTARDNFLGWCDENGFVLHEDFQWVNAVTRYPSTCPQGHHPRLLPNSIQQGLGGCRYCANRAWDVFYVVQRPDDGVIKLGITSGDPKGRLKVHAKDGYTDVLRLRTNLPGTVAHDTENECVRTLRAAGINPFRGREYFAAEALPLVLELADRL